MSEAPKILRSEIVMPESFTIIPQVQKIMEISKKTLMKLNKQYGTGLGIKFVPLDFLKDHPRLKSTYMGFVIREEPYHIHIVPENILTSDEAIRTTKHEFKHALDLICDPATDDDCPINPPSEERERRAEAFEEVPLLARPCEVHARSVAANPDEPCPICESLKKETRVRRRVMDAMREMAAAEMHLLGLNIETVKTIRGYRKKIEAKLWPEPSAKDISSSVDGSRDQAKVLAKAIVVTPGGDVCPFCAIKHLLNSKTFLIEAGSAGFESPVSIGDIDKIVSELDAFIIENKLRPIS